MIVSRFHTAENDLQGCSRLQLFDITVQMTETVTCVCMSVSKLQTLLITTTYKKA